MYMTNLAAAEAVQPIADGAEDALARLYAGNDLTQAETRSLFEALVDGRLGEPADRRHAGRAQDQGRDRPTS